MFTTVEKVRELTGYEVTSADIAKAQGLLESWLGKVEADFINPSDIDVMEKAVSYQSAYMKNNYDVVFEQAGVRTLGNSDSVVTFNTGLDAPFLAPLAVIAMRRLSFRGSRSVHTGPVFHASSVGGWTTE